MILARLKSLILSALYTIVLFCVLPVGYVVRLSHLNKDYLLTYLLNPNAC